MATDRLINPADPSPAGRNEATRSRTEDSVTKHWPRVLPEDNRVRTGVYFAHSGALVVQASAHGAGAGWLWIINDVGTSDFIAIRRVHFATQHGSALATPTSPRIALERFTFTGTASGAQITVAKRRSSDAAQTGWSVRTANTGMTQTPLGIAHAFFPITAITAVGGNPPGTDVWEPEIDEMPILAAGEGIRVYQPDAGTTSDTRRFVLDFILEEFTEF